MKLPIHIPVSANVCLANSVGERCRFLSADVAVTLVMLMMIVVMLMVLMLMPVVLMVVMLVVAIGVHDG